MNHAITTHNGKLTITNTHTGGHRTFQIKTQPKDAKFAPGERVVSLLTGPDNTSDYTGFGFLREDGTVAVWRSKRNSVFETYARMLQDPAAYEAKGCTYEFSVRCRKCNRELTTPESLASGLGPVCEGRE